MIGVTPLMVLFLDCENLLYFALDGTDQLIGMFITACIVALGHALTYLYRWRYAALKSGASPLFSYRKKLWVLLGHFLRVVWLEVVLLGTIHNAFSH